MNRYRICVYAICKNEETFAAGWMASMQEADEIVVLDTGSEDRTVEILRKLGAHVYEEVISPWRFDVARNRSLALVPEDVEICVCTDLDERFEPGWREHLEKAWQEGTGQARYRYTWNFNPDGSEGVVFWMSKIHARHGFYWVNPVHEVLASEEGAPSGIVDAVGIQLNHYADPTKSRAQYLPLLELAVRENPHNDRNMHYLGREYFFHGQWDACISVLHRHLSMPEATWRDERCASMRYLAREKKKKGERAEAKAWYYRAMGEAPYLREPYMELAMLLYEEQNWYGVIYLSEAALRIEERPKTYICEASAWGSLPYDLASLGYYYTGAYEKALERVEQALAYSPGDQRLLDNRRWMQEAMYHTSATDDF